MTFTKAQKRIISEIKRLGHNRASAGMLAHDMGLKDKTVKSHLKALEVKGAISSDKCPTFGHPVWAVTELGEIYA